MSELRYAMQRAAQHTSAQGRGRRAIIQAPIKGWNTRDSLAVMEPQYAPIFRNFVSDRGIVKSRKGSALYCDTGSSNTVEFLYEHLNGAERKLFAATATEWFDVTDHENPASIPNTATSGRWHGVTINGRSVFVNGADAPLAYTEAGAWAAHGFSPGPGETLDVSDLHRVTVHRNRLFFLEKDSTRMWYGAADAVTGTLTSFNLGLVTDKPGRCAAIASISADTGQGPDDLLAVFLDRGQVLFYSGSDPGNVNNWQLVQTYQMGRVIGDRPLIRLGGDVVAITDDGYVPVLQFLRGGQSQTQLALSDAISPTVIDLINAYADEPGWEAVLHPAGRMLIFNAAAGSGLIEQHVMNPATRAWSRFTGWDARCWLSAGGRLYYGTSDGRVVEANTGFEDVEGDIEVDAQTGYNYLGSPYDKQFAAIRAHLRSTQSDARVYVGASVDFSEDIPNLERLPVDVSGPRWDSVKWDTSKWGGGVARSRDWDMIDLFGTCIAIHIAAAPGSDELVWHQSDVLYDQSSGALTSVEAG